MQNRAEQKTHTQNSRTEKSRSEKPRVISAKLDEANFGGVEKQNNKEQREPGKHKPSRTDYQQKNRVEKILQRSREER